MDRTLSVLLPYWPSLWVEQGWRPIWQVRRGRQVTVKELKEFNLMALANQRTADILANRAALSTEDLEKFEAISGKLDPYLLVNKDDVRKYQSMNRKERPEC